MPILSQPFGLWLAAMRRFFTHRATCPDCMEHGPRACETAERLRLAARVLVRDWLASPTEGQATITCLEGRRE